MKKYMILVVLVSGTLFASNYLRNNLQENRSIFSLPNSGNPKVESDITLPEWVIANFEIAMNEVYDQEAKKLQNANNKVLSQRKTALEKTKQDDDYFFACEENRIKYIFRNSHKLSFMALKELPLIKVYLEQLKNFAKKYYEFLYSLLEIYPYIGNISISDEITSVYSKFQNEVHDRISEYYDMVIPNSYQNQESITGN